MNARLPPDSEIREAIARILATHSLDELTYDRVYMLLEANFVTGLAEKSAQIKKQLDLLLFHVFVDYAAASSPGRLIVSPDRQKDVRQQPIRKIFQHRLIDLKKKRSVELCDFVESVVASEDFRHPAHNVLKDGAVWISSGLYPQNLEVRFTFPVCLERVSVVSLDIGRIRVECHRVASSSNTNSGNSKRSPTNWSDGDMLSFEKELDAEGVPWQENEILLNFIFTSHVHITILEGYSDFSAIQRLRFFGITLDTFSH